MLLYLLAVIVDEPALTVPPPLPASAQAQPPHLFLKPPASACDKSADSGEIVVCGGQDADQKYRLQTVDPTLYVDPAIRAQTNVAGGTLGLTANTVTVGGIPSNRIMLNFKIKF